MPNTSRLILPYPAGADEPDVPQDIQDLADRLDAITMDYAQGTLGSRPAAGAATAPRWYWATDVNKAYYTDGTTWREIINATDPRLSDQRTPLDNTVSTAKLQDDAVTLGKLAAIGLLQFVDNAGTPDTHKLIVKTSSVGENLGAGAGGVNIGPIAGVLTFPTACIAVMRGGTTWYGDAGHTSFANRGASWINYFPKGAGVGRDYSNVSAIQLFPVSYVTAIGY